MSRKPTALKDYTKAEFRVLLIHNSFAYLPTIDRFSDLRHPHARRTILPVKTGRGRIQRRETLASLLAARAAFEAEQAESARARDAALARIIAIAGNLAPQAFPADRASLEGPAAVHQMAEDCRTIATRDGSVTQRDLMLAGWSETQITAHCEAARQLGYSRENGAMA
jgi:hypothetical protein